jgi:Tol biopolymer transport system component/DNA-binding winged helix-turn-helix (wHTH) protein
MGYDWGSMSLQARYKFGPFQLDPNERDCRRGNEPIPLTGKAFDLLLLLVRDPGRTIPKAALMNALWPETAVEEGNLTQTVFLLRKALGDDPEHAVYIQTAPRMGYKFVAPVTFVSPTAEVPIPVPVDGRKKRMHWVLGFAATAAIMVAATMLLGRGAPSRSKAPTLTPFSFDAGRNMYPVWSPDGKGVAFEVQRNETDAPQVYVRYLDSPTALQLTHEPDGGTPIAWTSGGRIVFQSSRPPRGLWTISPVGGEAEPLLGLDADARDTHVSGDGSVVAHYGPDKDGLVGVLISSPAGSPAKPYAPAPFATRMNLNTPTVRFSPDGKQILLMRRAGAGEEAWLMPYPPDPSNPPRRIFRNLPPRAGTPTVSWMPDSRRIVMAMSLGSETSRLYMADTVSGQYSVLSSGTTPQIAPAVSPDGSRVIFQEAVSDQDLVSIDLASARVTTLLATNRREDLPAWSARTAALAYITDRTGQPEIWQHKPGDTDRPLVTSGDFPPGTTAAFMNPLLSPDGSRIIYSRIERSGPARIWMSSVAGGAPVRVDTHEADQEQPGSWSPDGAWIAALRFYGGKTDLYKIKTTGHAQPELLQEGLRRSGSGIMPAWSPTGEWILNDDGGPKLISPDGKITRELKLGKVLICGFSRDGALLYCMRQERINAPGELFSVPVAGGPEKIIGSFAPEYRPQPQMAPSLRLTLTPDGKSLTYSIRKTTSNLWMMDGIE